MNKKLIALAVAAAFSAPVTMADMMVYGSIHMDIRGMDNGNSNKNTTVNNNGSSLGFKGFEDLGNGLKTIFKYDMTYSGLDSATAIGSANDSYIGLTGGFGTFLVGRHNTPAKSAYYAAGNDHLDDSIIDFNAIGFTENRVSNAIAYVSPNLSGIKFAAAVVPGEQSGADDSNDENGFMDSYSLGLMYKGYGVRAGVGYEVLGDTTTSSAENNDIKTLQLGASYTFMNNYTIGAQYSNDDNCGSLNGNSCDSNTDGSERTTWAIAGKAQFGNNAIIANYGNTQLENNAGVTSIDTNHIGIALEHTMSKRTNVYVAFKNQDSEPSAGEDLDQLAVGMIHKF